MIFYDNRDRVIPYTTVYRPRNPPLQPPATSEAVLCIPLDAVDHSNHFRIDIVSIVILRG
jgi:hypothetical protein